jgi:formate dehydrogenase
VLYEGGEAAKRQPKILGATENALGIREWLEKQGHEVFVTSDKDGPNSAAEKYLPQANIVISQPFWPFYLTEDRFNKAKNLKLAITAG